MERNYPCRTVTAALQFVLRLFVFCTVNELGVQKLYNFRPRYIIIVITLEKPITNATTQHVTR
jgi:hypothetical protein